MSTNKDWAAFEAKMHELKDLDGVVGLLGWDEETYTPPAGRPARGRQTGTVEAIKHRALVDPALGSLLATLGEASDLDADQQMMIKRLARERDRAVKVPESLVKAMAEARSLSLAAWQAAKEGDDYASFAPHLDRVVGLLRERADAIGSPSGDRYDALLDEFEPGMTVAALEPVLKELVDGLVPLVTELLEDGTPPETAFLDQSFDAEAQWSFTMEILGALGFLFERGRQDRSSHPFTATMSEDDIRLTTRIEVRHLLTSIFSTVHECGHGLYEQGFDPTHSRTPLAAAPSMGIHESQSRLWENQIGRSLPFWQQFYPSLQKRFEAELSDVDAERFFRAVNVVERSFIRTEADEVTYNLHIALRFELERKLLSGDLVAADLPGAWNDKMNQYFAVTPPNDAKGCLQDIHWAWGAIGYFPTYSIGNIYSAQIMAAYQAHRPEVWADVEAGNFTPLLDWLRQKIHRRGYTADADAIIEAATGRGLTVQPLIDALRQKYRPIYGL